MSWARVVAANIQKPEEQPHADENGGTEIPNEKQQRQLALLEEALKSPQDAVSGDRWCLGCGKRYRDAFTLAQHVKDKHGGVNASDHSKDARPGGEVVMSDYMFPSLLSVQPSQVPQNYGVRRGAPEDVRRKRNGSKARERDARREKKMTALKKAYVKQKAEKMTRIWRDIIASLNDKIEHVEALKDAHESQMETQSARSDLQHKHAVSCEQLRQLRAMEALCQEKLKLIELSMKRRMHNRSRKISKEDVVKQGYFEREDVPVQLPSAGWSDIDEAQASDGQSSCSCTESIRCSDDEYSSSSDESFDLQWGDTLHTWAQSMGHVQEHDVSRITPKQSEDSLPVVLSRSNGGSSDEGTCSGLPAKPKTSVRIISTQFSAMCASEVEDQVYQSAAHTDDVSKKLNKPHDIGTLEDKSLCMGGDPVAKVQTCHKHTEPHIKNMKHTVMDDVGLDISDIPLSKEGNLSVQPKRYTGSQADVESYVDQLITDELNQKTSILLKQLIEWQERTRKIDPVNAKRKRRYVCGMREASKATRLGKAIALVVAPNIQPLQSNEDESSYPVNGILEECKKQNVDVIFALSRRKMGKLLGQKKNASLFAILDVSGAESDFRELKSIAKDLKIT